MSISPQHAGRTFVAPGPGAWQLDASHCQRPRARIMQSFFVRLYTEGFREGMARCGAMLDTIEVQFVHGFPYTAVRPLAAPPDANARALPPRWVFWLMSRLHPSMRRRSQRAVQALQQRPWLEDTERYFDVIWPRAEAHLLALQRTALDGLDDEALLAHLEHAVDAVRETLGEHFRSAPSAMVPVGDFVAHTVRWTGCTKRRALSLLSGSSPESLDSLSRLDPLIDALRQAPDLCDALQRDDGRAPADILEALRAAPAPVSASASAWLEHMEQRIITGPDPAEQRGIELPQALLTILRARLADPDHGVERERTARATAALRAEVPDDERAHFDALLDEARAVYRLRDARAMADYWALGLLRRAVLEVGQRLVERGQLHDAEHGVDLTADELAALLRGEPGPSPDDTAAHASWREATTSDQVPDQLGPKPGPPPPPEWLPPAAARVARALGAYIEMMFDEAAPASAEEAASVVVRGLSASPGVHEGRACLVHTPADFARIETGDVLVARMTTASFNILLPMLGAVVTDRGGILSHPAIVSREYGIPGVVGCRDATRRIADGARVRVDGEAGTVTVLS